MNITYYVVVTFYIVSLLQNVTIIKRNPLVENQNQNCLLVQRQNDNIAPGALGREDLSLALTRELNLDTHLSDISAGILALLSKSIGAIPGRKLPKTGFIVAIHAHFRQSG